MEEKEIELWMLIEAPDGHTWEQGAELRKGEKVADALRRAKKRLGKSYWICDWWLTEK